MSVLSVHVVSLVACIAAIDPTHTCGSTLRVTQTHAYHPYHGSDLMFYPHPFPFFLRTSQSSAPSQPWMHTCVHRQTGGIFPLSCQSKLGFLCGGLPERLQLCWWFSNVHICSSEIGQSQPFSFIGCGRLSEDKKLYPCQDYNQPLFLLSKSKRPL